MKGLLLILILFISSSGQSQQLRFSIATDLGLQRSFKKGQQYWAVGHTVHLHFNYNKRNGVYGWISYYSNGKFTNALQATAKSPSTNPQQMNYSNNAIMRFKHISLGWRHYLKGEIAVENKLNIYGYAGWGLMLGRVENKDSPLIDTTIYILPVARGKANFKRLTIDIGLGWEWPIGYDVYFYNEARVWLPTTDYPSKYLFVNRKAPLVASLDIGLRILFN
ncbi:MAG TPA: hypothetical protein VLJ68_00875 [Chitinophagaceae bacterium]|nr:hypothetical protein [Chitinophagaceae bacterium]